MIFHSSAAKLLRLRLLWAMVFGLALASARASAAPYYVHPSLSMQNVDARRLVEWLDQIGIKVPISIRGGVSFQLRAGIPVTSPTDARAYQLDGYLSSPLAVVENIPLEDFAATIRYRDGVVTLQTVRFRLPKLPGESEPAALTGRGSLALLPNRNLDLSVDLSSVQLTRLVKLLGADLGAVGVASGRAEVHVANADFANPQNWSGSASLAIRSFKFPGVDAPEAVADLAFGGDRLDIRRFHSTINDSPLDVVGELKLAEDRNSVAFDKLKIGVFGGSLQLTGAAPIGKPTPRALNLRAEGLSLALAEKQLRPVMARMGVSIPADLSGHLSFTFDGDVPYQALGDYSVWRIRNATVNSPRLAGGGRVVEAVSVAARFDGTNFLLEPLRWTWPAALYSPGDAGGVDARVSAQLSLFGKADVRIRSTRTPAAVFYPDLTGFLDGTFTASAPALRLKIAATDPASWTADLDLTGDGFGYQQPSLRLRRVKMKWQAPNFDVSTFDAALLGSAISGSGRIHRDEAGRRIAIERAGLTTEFGRFAVDGVLPFEPDQPAKVRAEIVDGNLDRLSQLLGPQVFGGSGGLKGTAQIELTPRQNQPRLLSAKAEFQGALAGRAAFETPWSAGGLSISDLVGGNGSVDLDATVPVTVYERPFSNLSAHATWKDAVFTVAKLSASVNRTPFVAKGKAMLARDAVAVENITLSLFGGEISGRLRYPLDAAVAGEGSVRLAGIDLAEARPLFEPHQVRLEGRIDGDAQLGFPVQSDARTARPMVVSAKLSAPRLRLENLLVERASANVATESGLAKLNVRGDTLGGLVEWNGVEVLPQGRLRSDEGSDLASRGTLVLRSIDLGRLIASAPRRRLPPDLVSGSLNARLQYTRPPSKQPTAAGAIEVVDFANSTSALSRRLQSPVTFDGRWLRLSNVSGDLLEGRLRGAIALDSENMAKGAFYRATLFDVSAPEVFRQLGADPGLFGGKGNITARGRISTAITGSGTVEVERGEFASLELSSWRSPIEVDVNLSDYSGRCTLPRASALLGGGQLRGRMDLRWGLAPRFESSLDFNNVNLRTLRRSSSTILSFVGGRTTGRLGLRADVLRSVDDLRGDFTARLEDTQPASTPAYARVLSLLTGVGGQSLVFSTGTVEGLVANGGVRLNRLELVSQRARITGGGILRRSGAIDMDLTSYTGNTSVSGRGREYLAAQLLTAANPTLAVITRINQLVSDRVIAVKVTGTVSAPNTQVKPGPTLTAEAARFLLGSVVPVPGVVPTSP